MLVIKSFEKSDIVPAGLFDVLSINVESNVRQTRKIRLWVPTFMTGLIDRVLRSKIWDRAAEFAAQNYAANRALTEEPSKIVEVQSAFKNGLPDKLEPVF